MPETLEQPKKTVPPVDGGSDLDEANKLLKRVRRQLADLKPEWRTWVLQSLAATKYED